jgi:hypothetical protein
MRILRVAHADTQDYRFMLRALRAEAIDAWRCAMKTGALNGKSSPATDLLTATEVISMKKDAPERLVIVVGDGQTVIGQLPTPP